MSAHGMGVETREALLLGDLPHVGGAQAARGGRGRRRAIREVVALVGRNPLTLHVAARFYLELQAGGQARVPGR